MLLTVATCCDKICLQVTFRYTQTADGSLQPVFFTVLFATVINKQTLSVRDFCRKGVIYLGL